ncbi:hypothetical protein [Stutzerimonas stutzeri]|uniref:hypothetical protein n=1 Tax=Stutzerimonas stutzeri TaxID=316 RepID=UPI00210B60B8|nr:hypothetical protein [Stutzerimonas stutzeri]MCQ4259844.1 hypothetical protein [Stutzerimonas stutzeri]
MLDSANRFFIDGGSVRGSLAMQKSNGANVNIIRADVAWCFIDGEHGIAVIAVLAWNPWANKFAPTDELQ